MPDPLRSGKRRFDTHPLPAPDGREPAAIPTASSLPKNRRDRGFWPFNLRSKALGLAGICWLLVMPTGLFTGCRTTPPNFAPVDLHAPEWKLLTGQAVWHLPDTDHELAGELIVAFHPRHGAYVQFSKTTLPLIEARRTEEAWRFHAVARGETYSGRGDPPARILWLQLPTALAYNSTASTWVWTPPSQSLPWRLEHRSSGEWLEGFLDP